MRRVSKSSGGHFKAINNHSTLCELEIFPLRLCANPQVRRKPCLSKIESFTQRRKEKSKDCKEILKCTFALCCSLLLLCSFNVHTQTVSNNAASQTNAALDARVRAEISSFKGHVHLFAKNLDSGETYELNADDVVPTASTIKVAIMVEAFARVSEGRSKWTDDVVLTPQAKKVYGSGVLQNLSDNLHLTLRDVVTLMIIVSDNAAANLVLDVVTPDAVNARMDLLGLKQTRVLRKIGAGNTPSSFGKSHPDFITRYGTGMTTPREMLELLEMIERGQIINPAASREMIDIMKHQQLHYGIGRNLQGIEIASKSGALDHLRSDVGIVYTRRGRIAMAVTCNDISQVDYSYDNPGDLLIARLSQILINGLGK